MLHYYRCRWHGCDCQKDRSLADPRTGFTLETLRQRTRQKEQELKDMGFNLVTMWQCQFEKQIAKNEEMKNFVQGLEITERLRLRDGLYGGRTGASILHASVENDPDMKIFYLDFTR